MTSDSIPPLDPGERIDLAPARWIWLPSERTLPNTVLLFRREFRLPYRPVRVDAWVSADSRYRLSVNGERVQWGPAPCDPRCLDVDPVDLTGRLKPGMNVIAAEVLFFGHGDGTWVTGRPGFIFRMDIECADGQTLQVVSDASWQVLLDRAHPPGQYKRYFLRALQEVFDARLRPADWAAPGGADSAPWTAAMPLDCPSDKPACCARYPDYLYKSDPYPAECRLVRRCIPALTEPLIESSRLAECGLVDWCRDPNDWFDFRMPDAFTIRTAPVAAAAPGGGWDIDVPENSGDGVFLTFEFAEQIVGWPFIEIDAPAGTTVEIICQEAHDPAKNLWLDTHLCTWTRLICREGLHRFELFDFESLRWLQLHVRGHRRPVRIAAVGVRRRLYPWPNAAHIRVAEPAVQRLFDASVNGLCNSAQETCMDCVGRERQQYSGDCAHQLTAVRYAFGEVRQARRFLLTYGQGLTHDDCFLDCWPATDRFVRVAQRHIGFSHWGPILDHGVQFVFDCWEHYRYSGDGSVLTALYPRLQRFARRLESWQEAGGLLPVDGLGVPCVWMDFRPTYARQRHKQCAFNLYVAAMLKHALAPIADNLGESAAGAHCRTLADELVAAAVARFWDGESQLFVNNLPWLEEEGGAVLCDRSLATAVLFDQCPGGRSQDVVRTLTEKPESMRLSYPANAVWRYRALAAAGRIDVVLEEFREIWARMPSVVVNNTIQEWWHVETDGQWQWSHAAVAPLYLLFTAVLGLNPVEPGCGRIEFAPQLGDLAELNATAWIPQGAVRLDARRIDGGHAVCLELPQGVEAVLLPPPPDATDASLPGQPDRRPQTLAAGRNELFIPARDAGRE